LERKSNSGQGINFLNSVCQIKKREEGSPDKFEADPKKSFQIDPKKIEARV